MLERLYRYLKSYDWTDETKGLVEQFMGSVAALELV